MKPCRNGMRAGPARARWIVFGLATLPGAGCGDGDASGPAPGLWPVTGRVLVGGEPASGVEVRLHPLNRFDGADAPRPCGTTDAEGRFRLRMTESEEGAPAGQYVATLAWEAGPGGADRLGGAFVEPEGSGLVAVIGGAPTELPPFEVGRPGRPGRSP